MKTMTAKNTRFGDQESDYIPFQNDILRCKLEHESSLNTTCTPPEAQDDEKHTSEKEHHCILKNIRQDLMNSQKVMNKSIAQKNNALESDYVIRSFQESPKPPPLMNRLRILLKNSKHANPSFLPQVKGMYEHSKIENKSAYDEVEFPGSLPTTWSPGKRNFATHSNNTMFSRKFQKTGQRQFISITQEKILHSKSLGKHRVHASFFNSPNIKELHNSIRKTGIFSKHEKCSIDNFNAVKELIKDYQNNLHHNKM